MSDKPTADHYETLQVRPDADRDVIEAAYELLRAKYRSADWANVDDVSDRVRELDEAWEALGDPDRRAAYDAAMGHSAAVLAEAVTHHGLGASPETHEQAPGDPIADEALLTAYSAADASPTDDRFPVVPGQLMTQLEDLFPIVWIAMLVFVAYIGIYYGVDGLPGANPLPDPLYLRKLSRYY